MWVTQVGAFLSDSSRLMIASWTTLFLTLYMGFWESNYRLVLGRKTTEEATLGRLGTFCFALFTPLQALLLNSSSSWGSFSSIYTSKLIMLAPFIIFFLALSAGFWERFLRVVAGRKVIKAVEERAGSEEHGWNAAKEIPILSPT
jgi:hypothetical protein